MIRPMFSENLSKNLTKHEVNCASNDDFLGLGNFQIHDSNVPCKEQTLLDLSYLSLIHGVCKIELVSLPIESDSSETFILLRARQVSDASKPLILFE